MGLFSREPRFLARWAAWACVGILACGAAGCGRFRRARTPPSDTPLLLLDAKLDKEIYQPGEAVVCSVELTNASKKPIEVSLLCTDTLEFWFGPAGTDLRFKRVPVRSAREKACEMVKLAPGEKTRRDFLLVDVTQEEGVAAIHVFCRPTCDNPPASPYFIAPAVLYKVDGPVALRRDRNGVLLKDQAISLAKEWLDRPVSQVDAVLVRNEAGFLDWWVTLDVDQKQDPEPALPRRAVLINAHTGALRGEAKSRPKPTMVGANPEKKGPARD